MARAILMPQPGQMTEECTVVAWHKREGDQVRRGDILFEIETDKSVMDVEAFDDGVLLRILVDEGATVPVNTVCAYVGTAGEAIPEAETLSTALAPTTAPTVAFAAAVVPTPPGPTAASETPAADARVAISPRASRLVVEGGLDARTITGSGPEGRIVERDVRAAIAARATAPTTPIAPAHVPVPPVQGDEEPRPLTRIRRVIADRLTQSWITTPHFTVTVAADVTKLLALRQELKEVGVNLTVTDFVLAATAQALAEFPDVNSRTDGISVWSRRRVHLGVAVSLPAGLVVPVIRDADGQSISALHDQAAALAAAAREGTLRADDMTGGTFTVSNLGMFGVEEFSAIINPGEAAILAVASALPTVVAIGDGMSVRQMMKITLSADHRLVDGEMGARFVGAIRRRLEDAASFRNEVLSG